MKLINFIRRKHIKAVADQFDRLEDKAQDVYERAQDALTEHAGEVLSTLERDVAIDIDPLLVPKAGTNKAKALLAMNAGWGFTGLTDDEVAKLSGLSLQAAGTARRAFVKDGLAEPAGRDGAFRLTVNGNEAVRGLILAVLPAVESDLK